MSPRLLLAAALLLSPFALSAPTAIAAAAPRLAPLPNADLSRLPAERAAELRAQRASFENAKDVLIGDPLAETYALLGAAYASNGLYDVAAVALDNAIALAPGDGRWLYLRGALHALRQQGDAARADFEQALKLDPGYLPIRIAVANSRIAAGNLDGARDVLERAPRHEQVVPLVLLASIAMKQQRYADAVDALQRALALDPQATQLYARLADAHAAAGDAKAAAQARAKAGEGRPVLYDPLGQRILGEGAAPPVARPAPAAGATAAPRERAILDALRQIDGRQFAAARSTLDAALKQAPQDSMLLALYGHLEAASGNFAAAQARLDAARRADPANGMVEVGEGLIKEMRDDDAGAREDYQQAIRVQPNLTAARLALAAVELRAKRYGEAIAQYKAILREEPGDAQAWTRLLAAEALAGRCADTLAALNEVLRKAPDDAFLLQLFVRSASTCAAVGAAEKRMALDYAAKQYRGNDRPAAGEAYALALAANGQWDDAVKTQEGVMFVVLRNEGEAALAPYKDVLEQLRARKLPALPWSARSPLFHPPRARAEAGAAAKR